MARLKQYKATISYIVLIILVNSLFAYLPEIKISDQAFSPADIAVGVIYIARDFSQREIRSYVLLAMVIGCVLSYLFADPSIAIASICAFIVGEIIDWLLFTYTKKSLSQRLIVSSLCSCPLDTLVFLAMINHLSWLEYSVMTIFKFMGIFVVWWSWRWQSQSTTT